MAFTEQNKADAYLFFVLAFNAAPGTVYGGQIVEAYESGMTTAEIVDQYVTKAAFKATYPDSQTNAEFASALVSNVASLSTATAVKTAAVADIEKALAAGWTKAQVITQIIGNLAAKTVADAEWGTTVAQLNNKIAVAKVLTEGDKALNTTDVATLQGPLANVTENAGSVQDALNGAGALADKIDALNAANKAQAAFYAADKALADHTAVYSKATSAAAAAKNVLDADFSDLVDTTTTGYARETVSAATQAAIVNAEKQKNADALNKAKVELDVAKSEFLKNNSTSISKAKLDAYVNAKAAAAAASDAVGTGTLNSPNAADTGAIKGVNDPLKALIDASSSGSVTTGAAVDVENGTVTAGSLKIIAVQSGKLALDAGFVKSATADQLNAAQKLLDGIVNYQTATIAQAAANESLVDATTALSGANVAAVDTALGGLSLAQANVKAVDKVLKDYNDAIALLNKDTQLQKAVDAAGKAFEDAGQPIPDAIKAGSLTSAADDVFLVSAESNKQVLSGFAAGDKIYAGKDYAYGADVTKGNDSLLEVFFKTNGASTDVFIEQKAFGSNSADDTGTDMVKVTLTGVTADKLAFEDGFITLA